MQLLSFLSQNNEITIPIPSESKKIYKNIHWGKFEHFFTPAFWYAQVIMHEQEKATMLNYKLGETFEEEVIACLVGGYGIPSEVGNAKFNQLKFHLNKLLNNPIQEEIEELMLQPINISGRDIKYRFAKQKALYIFEALKHLNTFVEKNLNDIELRNELLKIKGIGPKTASWIVRNYRQSDKVAILDIHIHRAGLLIGFFKPSDDINRDYFKMEKKFLEFCKKIEISSAKLDAVIWRIMKTLNQTVLKQLRSKNLTAA